MKKLLLGLFLLVSSFAAKDMVAVEESSYEKGKFTAQTYNSAINISKDAEKFGLTDIKKAADALAKATGFHTIK